MGRQVGEVVCLIFEDDMLCTMHMCIYIYNVSMYLMRMYIYIAMYHIFAVDIFRISFKCGMHGPERTSRIKH